MSGQLACYGIGARSARLRKFALPTPRYGQPAKICTGNLTGSELQKNMHSAKILLSPYTSAAHTETARQSSSMRDCAHSYGHRSRHSGRTWFATYTLQEVGWSRIPYQSFRLILLPVTVIDRTMVCTHHASVQWADSGAVRVQSTYVPPTPLPPLLAPPTPSAAEGRPQLYMVCIRPYGLHALFFCRL